MFIENFIKKIFIILKEIMDKKMLHMCIIILKYNIIKKTIKNVKLLDMQIDI